MGFSSIIIREFPRSANGYYYGLLLNGKEKIHFIPSHVSLILIILELFKVLHKQHVSWDQQIIR